jgi:hypothetical protein
VELGRYDQTFYAQSINTLYIYRTRISVKSAVRLSQAQISLSSTTEKTQKNDYQKVAGV